jgi:hypothetical protein
MDIYNTTSLHSGSCTNEIVGFGIALGLSLSSSVVSCALLYMCYIKPKPITKQSCPYCQEAFDQAHVREHLQTCPEHLKTYTPKGRASMVQELDRKVFYSSSLSSLNQGSKNKLVLESYDSSTTKKLLAIPDLHVENP